MSGEFIGQLLHAGTIAHVFHLKERSYARHVALGDFYDAIIDKADSLAEAIQGGYGLLDGYPSSFDLPEGDPLDWLNMLSRYVDKERKTLPDDSEIQNLVDEIAALIDSTQYKLRFLS